MGAGRAVWVKIRSSDGERAAWHAKARAASDFALWVFCEVTNPSRMPGLGSVYSRSVAGATVYVYTFLLATPYKDRGPHEYQ